MSLGWWLRLTLCLALVVYLGQCSGCANVPTAEYAWQSLNAIDTEQTVTITHSPCLYESDSRAAWLYGSQRPTTRRVLLTNAALATLHFYAASWIDRHDWPAVEWLFYGASFAYSAQAVVHNQRLGIPPVGSYKGC